MGDLSKLLAEIAQVPADDAASAWREPLRPGDVVGRYAIRREIGRGGFGAVHEAFDPELGRTVALKALKPGKSRHGLTEYWIRKEAEAVAKLDHPAIVTIHDVGTCPSGAYLVMELLHGETLAERVARGPLRVDESLRIAEQMAEGLAHAHERGVLHRDLKPANVFVCEDGRVKLLDFGLAHLLGTEGSSGAGTPAYMAPEQAAGQPVDERADVYAAGMVLGEMLTGKRPVERTPTPELGGEQGGGRTEEPGDRTEQMWEAPMAGAPAAAASPGPKLAGIPRPVAKAVGAALAEDPAARPRNGLAWLAELRSARLSMDRPRRARRVALLAGVGATVGLAVAGVATWRVWERQIPGGRPTVAVADFVNETGEKDLDSISGLLITSLEQGTQLRVLTRGRMVDVLKQLGKGPVERVDEPMAREVGRETRAHALLLASIRKFGDTYVVEMRALDPLHDEYIFTVSDRAAGKGAVFDLVDRLGAATRKRMGASATSDAPPPRVASITTESPRAWALLVQSRQAMDQLEEAESRRLAQEAVKEDPDFALGYHQLAVAAYMVEWRLGVPKVAPGIKELEAAEARAHRLPEKEKLTLRLFRALVDWRIDEAIRLSAEATAAYPLDKDVLLQVGDFLFHQHLALPESIGYFERAHHLDPTSAFATNHLVQAAWLSGQSQRAIPVVEKALAALRPEDDDALGGTPAGARRSEELARLASPLLSVGREAEAGALLDRATRLRNPTSPGHRGNAWNAYLCHHGRCDEAEAEIRAAIDRNLAAGSGGGRPRREPPYYQLGAVLITEGQMREGVAIFDARFSKRSHNHAAWVDAAVGIGSAEGIEFAYDTVPEADREPAWAVDRERWLLYAVAGDVARARDAVLRVRGTPEWQSALGERDRREGSAILAWSEGRRDEADRLFTEGSDRWAVFERFRGLLGAGALHFVSGDCPGAVRYLEAAREVPFPSEAWSHPRNLPLLLHRLATCYEQAGDLAKARERNAELLKRWEKADPDIPLVVEAKAMRERLAVK